MLLAAHEGEEVAIILPAIMLVGAFFVLRWANKNDKDRTEDAEAEPDVVPEDRPVGLVLPKLSASGASGGDRPGGDETTR